MLKLDPIFADGVILQAGKAVRISGSGDGTVCIRLGNEFKTVSSFDGRWSAEFPARDYNTVCELAASCNGETVVITDVTFGDVYLIAGQSNMQFKLREAIPDGEIYESDEIRLFSTDRLEDNERFRARDGWVRCDKSSAPHFSAIGYFLARDLHRRAARPIGLVSLYQGASVIQSWLSAKAVDELALNIPQNELHEDHHCPQYSRWNGVATLYNFGFKQILPFVFKAIVWYQGESNTSVKESKVYDRMLRKMIELWRNDLNDTTLPFVVIQIADFTPRNDEAWKRVQEAQERVALDTPYCHLVKSTDICESENIHPPTKHTLAGRISEIV